jgi:uncharacterized cysteine cluster protein YcgN (CxxCxxCC family)
MQTEPFWRSKRLDEMTTEEWESLCDGCGRCCLNKLEDADTGEIAWTDVACRLLDAETCRCQNYPERERLVPDCVQLTPETVRTLSWLPGTCAYRLIEEGRDLYWWHPLVSGEQATVRQAGISTSGKTVSEENVPVERFEDRIVTWPLRVPAKARRRPIKKPPLD